jgi:hypothetical protein
MVRCLPVLPLLAVACVSESPVKGSQLMGTFSFTATLVPEQSDCPVVLEADGGGGALVPVAGDGGAVPVFPLSLSFSATLSSEPEAGEAWLTQRELAREADFDGQVLHALAAAPRQLEGCGCERVTLHESITVALLSESQVEALRRRDGDGTCPEGPLDGGIPAPDDAGIRGPGPTRTGYDALRACGELVNWLEPGADCSCGSCRVVYRLEGTK